MHRSFSVKPANLRFFLAIIHILKAVVTTAPDSEGIIRAAGLVTTARRARGFHAESHYLKIWVSEPC